MGHLQATPIVVIVLIRCGLWTIGKIVSMPLPGVSCELRIADPCCNLTPAPAVNCEVSQWIGSPWPGRFLTYVHSGGQSLKDDFTTLAAALEVWETWEPGCAVLSDRHQLPFDDF